MSRIVLVGFMAAGKSTIGQRLARLLEWDFIDFDHEIERRTGSSIRELFREEGAVGFRVLEAALTDDVADLAGVVLAPGGGWITQPELLERLGPGTVVVWLRISPEEAVHRAQRDALHRPLLAGPDPLARARALIREREPLYGMADFVVDVDGRSPEEVALEIARLAQDMKGS